MERIEIRKLFDSAESYAEKSVTVCGWIRTLRDSKAVGFIEVNDGSCFKGVQSDYVVVVLYVEAFTAFGASVVVFNTE